MWEEEPVTINLGWEYYCLPLVNPDGIVINWVSIAIGSFKVVSRVRPTGAFLDKTRAPSARNKGAKVESFIAAK